MVIKELQCFQIINDDSGELEGFGAIYTVARPRHNSEVAQYDVDHQPCFYATSLLTVCISNTHEHVMQFFVVCANLYYTFLWRFSPSYQHFEATYVGLFYHKSSISSSSSTTQGPSPWPRHQQRWRSEDQ